MTIRMLVNSYLDQNENLRLEDYVRKTFEGCDKAELRRYCKEHEIFYKKSSTREMMLQRIYGMCKTVLSYKLLKN